MNWLFNLKVSTRILVAVIMSAIIGSIIGYSIKGVLESNAAVSISIIIIGIAALITIHGFLKGSICKPIKELSDKCEKLLEGDLDIYSNSTSDDEIGKLNKSFLSLLQTIKSFNKEADSLGKAIDSGDLTVRMNAAPFNGCWSEMAKGFNKNIDTIAAPMKEATNVLSKIAYNDYTMKIEGQYIGSFKQFAEGINTAQSRLLSVQDALVRVSRGDLSRLEEFHKIGKRSDNDKLMPAMIAMNEAIESLISEVNKISEAVDEGKLDVRGNADKFEGGYKTIIVGMNDMLDKMENPLNSALEVLNKISAYDFTMQMDKNYRGVFGKFAKTINDVQSHLIHIEEIVSKIAGGDLSELEPLKKAGKRSDNDQVVPAFISMMETIQDIINEIGKFTQAAVEGKLSIRSEAGKFKGVYMKIIQGLNATLDAVVEPVNEASSVLQEMAKGNLQVNVKGNYKGDHAEIKDALNGTIDIMKKYIGEISKVLVEMAGGNLDIGINEDYKGDFIKIKESLNQIIESLNDIFGNIGSAAEQVAAGSSQVSAASQSLSQGSTEQASAIEEITSSVTQAAAQTQHNATNANQANELAMTAKDIAVQGNSRMQDMVKAMAEINVSSTNISKIIKVIDDIAFQTNILALNAAVEAARAGQHGKGFAVVAEEVRNLAARSANAAKETTVMIEGSIQKVEVGTRIANDTAEALNKIVDGVAKAATIVGNISVASNEQATGISQINQAISQVAQVIQTNSATAEESASASEELSSQADLLKDSVSKLKLKKIKGNNSMESGLNTDMIRMIEDIVDKKKSHQHLEHLTGSTSGKTAVSSLGLSSKTKISLGEMDFGKY